MSNLTNKKILVVTSTFPRWPDDVEPPFVFELCKRLSKLGYDIDVIAPHAADLKIKEVMEGVTVYRYKYFFDKQERLAYSGGILSNLKKNRLSYFLLPSFFLFQFFAVFRRLKSKQYDVVHAHWLIPQGVICAIITFLLGKNSPRLLCTSHGSDLFSLQSFFMNKVKIWVGKTANKMTVVSSAMYRICVDKYHIDQNKLSIIPMGVDLSTLFVPVAGICRKSNRLIFVGRMVEVKGIEYLIDAVKKTRNTIPDIELLLVGDGPLKEKLQKKVQKLNLNNNIKFLGSVNQKELPALYSSSAIMVAPSIVDKMNAQEGFGLTVIEALGCGCLVIASNKVGASDIIDSKNGLIVNEADSDAIAEGIISLHNRDNTDQDKNNSENSIHYSKYDWDNIAQSYYELIINMLEENK